MSYGGLYADPDSYLMQNPALANRLRSKGINPTMKSVAGAWAFSFFLLPGSGELYIGDTRDYAVGGASMGLSVMGLGLMIGGSVRNNVGALIAGDVIFGVVWLFSAIDAPVSASMHNSHVRTAVIQDQRGRAEDSMDLQQKRHVKFNAFLYTPVDPVTEVQHFGLGVNLAF